MNLIRNFERRMGGRWAGVSFHREIPPDIKTPDAPMCFCKAVQASNTGPLTLTRKDISCPGALKSFGWQTDGGLAVAEKMIRQAGLKPDMAEKLIRETPSFDDEQITAITVGAYQEPDILISYVQPAHAMRFVMMWEKVFQTSLDFSFSSAMAVCGSIAAGAYTTQRVSCSFGCPESRVNGCIGRDRLVIGVPIGFVKNLDNLT